MKKPKEKVETATFIESMECLPVKEIPQGPEWTHEIKLDGYRLEAVQHKEKVTRRRNVLNPKFGYIADVLEDLWVHFERS